MAGQESYRVIWVTCFEKRVFLDNLWRLPYKILCLLIKIQDFP